MSPAVRADLLAMLAGAQTGSPVTLSIGHVSASGQCQHDSVLITDASHNVVKAVMSWVADRRRSSETLMIAELAHGGLLIS
jgi:hypothetical protein